jgi:hypothetical protein
VATHLSASCFAAVAVLGRSPWWSFCWPPREDAIKDGDNHRLETGVQVEVMETRWPRPWSGANRRQQPSVHHRSDHAQAAAEAADDAGR